MDRRVDLGCDSLKNHYPEGGMGTSNARKTPQCGVFSETQAVSGTDRKAPPFSY